MTLKFMLLLLKAVVIVTAGKYVYFSTNLHWFEARKHCQTVFTDLAPISSEFDIGLIDQMDLDPSSYSWIGLMKSSNSSSGWMWSGGGEVSFFFWGVDQAGVVHEIGNYGLIQNYGYFWDTYPWTLHTDFLCYKVHAVRKRMTWDKALQYCRKNHNDLASVASKTEMMLMEKELGKELSSFNIWIGLHFLDGTWQWMDGQPLSYESWGPAEKAVCPDITVACGALRVKGMTQFVGRDRLVNVNGVMGWMARDCTMKLHFLCY